MKTLIYKHQTMSYIILVFALTFSMGGFIAYGYYTGADTEYLAVSQMYYPAFIVFILSGKCTASRPIQIYMVSMILYMIQGILNLFFSVNLSLLAAANVFIHLLFIMSAVKEAKQHRIEEGTQTHKSKHIVSWILFYLSLWVVMNCISSFFDGTLSLFLAEIFDVTNWMKLIASIPLFLISFLPFLGEECGWRYFLQPKLQNKYGIVKGTLLLGVIWGIWHTPLGLFYYTTFENGGYYMFTQVLGCIVLSIIFAYVYMRSESIWVVSLIHYIHNLSAGVFKVDVLNAGIVSYKSAFLGFAALFLLFCPLLLLLKREKAKDEIVNCSSRQSQ